MCLLALRDLLSFNVQADPGRGNSLSKFATISARLPIELFTRAAKALVSSARRPVMAENPIPVCATADVPPGSVKSFEVGDERVAVYNIDGTFYATEAYCTHAMADLGDGILEGDVIECSLHFGAFHVPSGKVVQPPCCTDLKTFRTEVKDGQVYVDLSTPAGTAS
jgi:nitrite reductase/ring-hydroxylating ferredoxin subunit